MLLPLILGGALSVAAVAPAAAVPPQVNVATASGLVGIAVQAVLNNVDILNNSLNDVVEVNINDSLNNLLRNADIDLLSGIEVTVENVLNNLNVNVSDIDIEVAEEGIVITILGTGGIVDTITLV
jgi:hypothetical protein